MHEAFEHWQRWESGGDITPSYLGDIAILARLTWHLRRFKFQSAITLSADHLTTAILSLVSQRFIQQLSLQREHTVYGKSS